LSQYAVYELLKELGGTASAVEIRKLAMEKYPNATLYLYIANRLRKLERNGEVKMLTDGRWRIQKAFGQRPK